MLEDLNDAGTTIVMVTHYSVHAESRLYNSFIRRTYGHGECKSHGIK